ncbi:MAG: hypothetical protein V8S16_08085 [Gemmiger sp.]|uniref:hypothetical protein n=1 Tax=Gemmiger sp. TaxID=2049027 RepID=UPI00306BF67B
MAKFQSSARKDRGFAFPALKLGFLCDILRAENLATSIVSRQLTRQTSLQLTKIQKFSFADAGNKRNLLEVDSLSNCNS